MIEKLSKLGIQRGQHLSIQFFEKQIQDNLSNIYRRIRDLIDFQGKKKGKKKTILSEEEYIKELYNSFSLNFECNYDQSQKIINHKILKIIDAKFICDYPLFYEPKWKIWFEGEPTLRQLAALNQIAYGYFYRKCQQGEAVCLLKQTKEKGIYSLDIGYSNMEKGIKIEFGVAKILNTKNSQFSYSDYILYDSNGYNREQSAEDPRKLFNKQEAIVVTLGEAPKQKKTKAIYMTTSKLKQKQQIGLEPYSPFTYRTYKPEPRQIEEYLFKLKTFLWLCSSDNKPSIENQQNPSINQINTFMKKNAVNFNNSSNLVPFLEKIPNFEYNLSYEQKQLIQTNKNVIVIGRSGTGKTICGLLRLFSLETLLKIKLVGIKKFKSKDLDIASKMKNLFLTASPYLIRQLKISYERHEKSVKYQIQKKQQKNNKNAFDQNVQQNNISESIKDINMIKNKNYGNATCLNNLDDYDYPGFFTVQDFLIMLDGIYSESFFERDEAGNLKQARYEEDITFTKKQRSYFRSGSVYSEVIFKSFQKDFWDVEIKRRKQLKNSLSPHVVWTQIYSQIKGSIQSHKCPQFFISQQTYIQSSKNKFLTLEEKQEIYFIFRLYCNWKSFARKFDLMDLVNYLLNKMRKYSYKGPTLNYIFIDEVQDLTSSTIYLLSQVASNNIYYSGDTAQSIIKGVNFRFSDIVRIFHSQSIFKISHQEEPIMKHLTVNFRSHNEILKLANCLIKIIQLLFPKKIDMLKKQTSEDIGPSPVIVENVQQIRQILNIGCSKQFKMSSIQVILVRDEQSAQQVKNNFQNALILTIEESKGLQFNDVVIWRLLQKTKFQKLWKIIENLQIITLDENNEQIYENLTVSSRIKDLNIRDYQQIFSQIKFLYTAVTRAKDILIIYDSLSDKLRHFLGKLQLLKRYQKIFLEEVSQRKFIVKKKLKDTPSSKTSPWRKLGIKLYGQENYEKALVCFRNDGAQNMCLEIQAKIMVRQGQKIIQKLKLRQYQSNRSLEQQKKKKFQQAGGIFQKLSLLEEAGKAYYLCQDYQRAIYFFRKMNMFIEIANCYIKLHKYKEAASMYEKGGRYEKAVEFLRKGKNIIEALLKLKQYRQKILQSLTIQNYNEQKQELRRQIFENVEKKIHQKVRQNFDLQSNINNCAFYDFHLNFCHSDDQIQSNEARYYQKNIHNYMLIGEKQNLGLVLIDENPITENILNSLRIALLIDQDCSNKSFAQFIAQPQNIRAVLKKLENRQSYLLCFLISTRFNLFFRLQEYFLIHLQYKFSPSSNFQQFCRADHQKRLNLLMKKGRLQINSRAEQKINRFNFQTLRWCQNYINNAFINNLVQNLILCGLYRSCSVFFKEKSHFLNTFMEDEKFMQLINKQKIQNKLQKQKISYMRLNGWENKLKTSEIVYTLQILFGFCVEILQNQEDTNLQAAKAKEIQNREIQKIKSQFEIERQHLIKQYQSKLKQVIQVMEEVELYQQEKGELLQKIKALTDQIGNKQQSIKKIRNKIENLQQKSVFKRLFSGNYQELSKLEQQQIHLTGQLQCIKKFMSQQHKNVIKLEQQFGQKLKEKKQLIAWKQIIQKRISQNVEAERIKTEKFILNKSYQQAHTPKAFTQKTKILIKNQFKHLDIKKLSPFLSNFYRYQPFDEKYLRKILTFDLDNKSDIFLCEVCTFAISLLLKHDFCIQSLDLISGIPYTLQKIKKIQQVNKYTSRSVNYSQEPETKLIKLLQLLQKFYIKLVLKLLSPEKDKKFNKIFLGFLSCRVFDLEEQKMQALCGYGLIKTKAAMIFNLLEGQNQTTFSFFDVNYELLITQKGNIGEILVAFISKNYLDIFQEQLYWKDYRIQPNNKQIKKYKWRISKQLKIQQGKIVNQLKQTNQRRKKCIEQIYFGKQSAQTHVFSTQNLPLRTLREIKKVNNQTYIIKGRKIQLQKLKQKERRILIQIFQTNIIEARQRQIGQKEERISDCDKLIQQKAEILNKISQIYDGNDKYKKIQDMMIKLEHELQTLRDRRKKLVQQIDNRKTEFNIKCHKCSGLSPNLTLRCRHKFHLSCIINQVHFQNEQCCIRCRHELQDTKLKAQCLNCNQSFVWVQLQSIICLKKESLLCESCRIETKKIEMIQN